MKNYEFHILPGKSVMKEKIYGMWDAQIATEYVENFKKAAQPLIRNPWALLSDLNEWKTSKQEVIEIVGQSLKWAMKNNMVCNANILTNALDRLQLQRTLKEGGVWDIAKVFENEFQALSWLKERGF